MDEHLGKLVRDLHSVDFIDVIRTFLNLLESCMGPKGGIKILITSGGISVVTSSSSVLLNHYIFSHPMCILMSQVMKSQISVFGDYGFYTGVLAMRLLEMPLKQTTITQSQAKEWFQSTSSQVYSLLKHDSIKLKLDLSSVSQLIPIVRTILHSKPGCGLNRNEIDSLCFQIIKVFVSSVNDDFGDIFIRNATGIEEVKILSGVLYQVDVEEKYVQSFVSVTTEKCPGNIPLLLFNIMLTYTADKNENCDVEIDGPCDILKHATSILECAIKIGVKIVACQKVVHDSLRLFLQRNGILLMDRLGSELCQAIEKISGAKPISTLKNVSLKSLQSCLGFVDLINYVTYGCKSFVILEKNNANVATLLLQCNEGAFAELKIVIQQALKALRQITCQPYVLPGAGCVEMWLASQLRVQDTHGTDAVMFQKTVIGWLQKSLISITSVLKKSTLCTAADTTYCHNWSSWNPDNSDTCCCGMIRTVDVKAAGGTWIQPNVLAVNDLVFSNSEQFRASPVIISNKMLQMGVLDVYVSKCNAIKLALDTCINMLCVGVMIYKPLV